MAEPFPHISLTEIDDPLTLNHSTIFGFSSFPPHVAGREVQTAETEKARIPWRLSSVVSSDF
jgi:hypothetical protein